MCAFNYAWSLPVTWRSQHATCHCRNPVLQPIFSATCFIEATLLPIEVLHCDNCSCDLDLQMRTLPYVSRQYVPVYGTRRTKFQRQCFRKLSITDRQTDRQTYGTLTKYYATSRVVRCTYSFLHRCRDVTSEAWSNLRGGDLPVLVNWLQRHLFHRLHKLIAHLRNGIQLQQMIMHTCRANQLHSGDVVAIN